VGMRARPSMSASVAGPTRRRYSRSAGVHAPPYSGPSMRRVAVHTADSQRNYQHRRAVSGGEPFSAFGARATAAPVKRLHRQSLLSAPLGS